MSNNNEKKISDPVAYIPPDAKINLDRKNMDPPKTKYEKNKWYFNLDIVKKIVKGHYGNSENKT